MNLRAPRRRRSHRRRNAKIRIYNRRRRHNPAFFGNLTMMIVRSAWAIGGGVATRSLPQALLGDRNTGIMGYVANAVTAFGGGALISRLMRNPSAGEMWTIGGTVMLVGRLVEDWFGQRVVEFTSVGLPLPQLGQGDPAYDLRLMGDYINQSFPVPYSSLASGRMALPSAEVAAVTNGNKAAMGLGADPTWSAPWN
jgi:hypothetical protein